MSHEMIPVLLSFKYKDYRADGPARHKVVTLATDAGDLRVQARPASLFHRSTYRELLRHKHGRNQAAGYTEREIKQYGPREALIRTIRRDNAA